MANLATHRPALCIASHNVKGLNSHVKRRKILQHYNNQKIDILLLQETHFPKSYTPDIQEYFLLNDVNNISLSSLYAAHTATIRGKLIQISSRLRKARKLDIDLLKREFSSLS